MSTKLTEDLREMNKTLRRMAYPTDVMHPGVLCAHCGMQQQGSASVTVGVKSFLGAASRTVPVCHPAIDAYPDCYRLVTVYGEELGIRRAAGAGEDPRS